MIFQYQDEDSGEPVQMYRLARATIMQPLCIEKIESSNRFYVMSWDYNITAAVLRHAECRIS